MRNNVNASKIELYNRNHSIVKERKQLGSQLKNELENNNIERIKRNKSKITDILYNEKQSKMNRDSEQKVKYESIWKAN